MSGWQYLVAQLSVFLVGAVLLGVGLGWVLRRMSTDRSLRDTTRSLERELAEAVEDVHRLREEAQRVAAERDGQSAQLKTAESALAPVQSQLQQAERRISALTKLQEKKTAKADAALADARAREQKALLGQREAQSLARREALQRAAIEDRLLEQETTVERLERELGELRRQMEHERSSQGDVEALQGRATEAAQLEAQVASLTRELDEVRLIAERVEPLERELHEHEALRARAEGLEARLSELEGALAQAGDSVRAHDDALVTARARVAELETTLDNLLAERDGRGEEMTRALEEVRAERARLVERLRELEAEGTQLAAALESARQQAADAAGDRERAAQEASEMVATLEAMLVEVQTEREARDARIAELEQELADRDQRLARASELEAGLARAREEASRQAARSAALESDLADLAEVRAHREALAARLKAVDPSEPESRLPVHKGADASELQRALARLSAMESELARSHEELETLKTRIFEAVPGSMRPSPSKGEPESRSPFPRIRDPHSTADDWPKVRPRGEAGRTKSAGSPPGDVPPGGALARPRARAVPGKRPGGTARASARASAAGRAKPPARSKAKPTARSRKPPRAPTAKKAKTPARKPAARASRRASTRKPARQKKTSR